MHAKCVFGHFMLLILNFCRFCSIKFLLSANFSNKKRFLMLLNLHFDEFSSTSPTSKYEIGPNFV